MKNKKVLLIIFIFIFVGVTIAYYFNKTTFSNSLSLAEFDTTTTETFTSPTDWKPGDTTPKVVSITNNKSLPAAVRVSYVEKWYDKNNHLINNPPVGATKINLKNTHVWTKEGEYYYYIHPLLQGETVKFMDSVTYNGEFGDDLSCTTDGNIKTCNSVTNGVEGGTYRLIITVETVQYDVYQDAWNTEVALVPKPEAESFATDDWSTIVENIYSDNTPYEVGDTKTIEMDTDNDGTNEVYTLRIANTTTPESCSANTFSQTACGFVVEFSTLLKDRNKMNSTQTNSGGWRDSELRTYINTDIYNLLPDDLKNIIIDTKVVSGHGNIPGEENFITTDKLYLLSSVEVYGTPFNDTVTEANPALTRQLDYYEGLGVTQTTNKDYVLKRRPGYSSPDTWVLRSSISNSATNFGLVSNYGTVFSNYANSYSYVSPVFRIG